MLSYYASAQLSTEHELEQEIDLINNNPVIDTVLTSANGLVAVLNENRQVLSVNTVLLDLLGITNAQEVLGLRPGHVLNCIHSNDFPSGCGTGKFCASCGAVISIVSSMVDDSIVEKNCLLQSQQGDEIVDLFFKVRAVPVTISEKKHVLLYLQDHTLEQQRASLERVFYHDIMNVIQGLHMASTLLNTSDDPEEIKTLSAKINNLSERLAKEVEMQRVLSDHNYEEFTLNVEPVSISALFTDLDFFFKGYPVAKNIKFTLHPPKTDISLSTDYAILNRILINMIKNAFEATSKDGEVKVWADENSDDVTIHVWNEGFIPNKVSMRIFQRNFSTKAEQGRGLGTFSTKFFSEKYLKGKVEFNTSHVNGTVFKLILPKKILVN